MWLSLALLLAFCLAPGQADADYSYKLRWRTSPESDVAGYRVYARLPGTQYPRRGSCGSTDFCIELGKPAGTGEVSKILPGLPEEWALFARMTAYDWAGNESGFSQNEILISVESAYVEPAYVEPVSIVRLQANAQQPLTPGVPVTYLARTVGGLLPLQFKWLLIDSSGGQILRDWAADATVTWTPGIVSGGTQIAVWVRNAGSKANGWNTVDDSWIEAVEIASSTSDPDLPVTLSGLVASPSSPQEAGTRIRLSTSASGGSGSYLFAWQVREGGEWTGLRGWSTSSAIYWTPQAPGSYVIRVLARDAASSSGDIEASSFLTFSVPSASSASSASSEPIELGAISASRSSPQTVGTNVVFSATATGGSGSYHFRWSVSLDGTQILVQNWSSASIFSSNGEGGPGTYTIKVQVRETTRTSGVDDVRAVTFELKP